MSDVSDPIRRQRLAARSTMTDDPVTGSILAVRECVSLVLVYLSTDDGRTVPVPMEHRAFGWLLEAEGCKAQQLVGRRVCYNCNGLQFFDTKGVQ
jgi:hypothetical protein